MHIFVISIEAANLVYIYAVIFFMLIIEGPGWYQKWTMYSIGAKHYVSICSVFHTKHIYPPRAARAG